MFGALFYAQMLTSFYLLWETSGWVKISFNGPSQTVLSTYYNGIKLLVYVAYTSPLFLPPSLLSIMINTTASYNVRGKEGTN